MSLRTFALMADDAVLSGARPLRSVLVANRGVIARRVIRTAHAMGIRSVAVFSDADAFLPYVDDADEAIAIGGSAPKDSYLNSDAIIDAARQSGAEAIHPGYGFLSENADFAEAVERAGLIWVGPSADSIRQLGDKVNARNRFAAAGVPTAAGSASALANVDEAIAVADRIGYPVMVKAVAGGGGIGMQVATNDAELKTCFQTASDAAARFFGDGRVMVERFIRRARHVEIQVLGMADGTVIAMGERDCSVQRRNQKVAEETPSPGLKSETRLAMEQAAVAGSRTLNYRNAGTVEYLLDQETGEFSFLEMNTRLQVEHGITEMLAGIDLVEQQLLIAGGQAVSFDPRTLMFDGHAIELRIYAEDPIRFLPSPGTITDWVEPYGEGIRVDSGYRAGNKVTHFYDPLVAKLIVWGETRSHAIERAKWAIGGFDIRGIKTNLPFFAQLLDNSAFVRGVYDTGIAKVIVERAAAVPVEARN